jgi:hypothetical protein
MYLVLAWTSHLPPSSDDVASVSPMMEGQASAPFPRDCSLHLQRAPCFWQASHQNPEEVSYCPSARRGGIAIIGQGGTRVVGDDPSPTVSPDHGKVPFACRPGSSSLSALRTQVRMCNARTAMQVTHVLSPSSKSNLS